MSFSPTRPTTADDTTRIEEAAKRFARNHGIKLITDDIMGGEVDYAISHGETQEDRAYLEKLWRRAVIRAFRGDGDTTGWGYVGWHVD